jgi:hypothetical protein
MLWAHLEMMETHALLLQYFITHLERRRRRGSSHTKRVYPSNYARELYDVLPDACAKLNYSSSVRKQCCRGKIITRRTLDTLRRCEKDLGGGGGVKICRARQKLIHCLCCCYILWVSAWIQLINGIAGVALQNAQYNNWPRSPHIVCIWREYYHISLSGCQRNFALANCFLTLARLFARSLIIILFDGAQPGTRQLASFSVINWLWKVHFIQKILINVELYEEKVK